MSNNTAIILIALGGPRSLDEVGSFMTAFTGRPAPQPVVAAIIDRYKLIGGKSPLPDMVQAQAKALEEKLQSDIRVYEGFRYSKPTITESCERAVKNGTSRVIGLSLSPFEATITTGAYQAAFEEADDRVIKKTFIPSWHDNKLFIKAWQEQITKGLKQFSDKGRNTAVIFTSHSIPLRYITSGDPYQKQIEETVKLVANELNLQHWRIAWQSKSAQAGEPWLEPEVERSLDEIARQGFPSVFEIPIGFTCDNLETLYDIDILHRTHAKKLGIEFERAESLNLSPLFIKALADVVKKKLCNKENSPC